MTVTNNTTTTCMLKDDASEYINKKQWQLLVRLIEKYSGSTDTSVKSNLKRWIAALPEEVKFGNNSLLWLSINLHPPYIHEASTHFSENYHKNIDEKNHEEAFVFWISYATVKFYYLDRFSDLAGWLKKGDELLAIAGAPGNDDLRSEFFVAYFNALMFAKPEKEQLNIWYKKLSNELLHNENCHIKTNIYNNLIFYNLRMGNMREARLLHKEALGLVHPDTQHPFNIIMQSNIFSMVSWLNLKPKKAIESVTTGIKHADKIQIKTWHAQLYSQIVYSHICAGEFVSARKALKDVEKYKDSAQVLDNGQYHYLLGWLSLCENNLDDAKMHLTRALELSTEAGVLFSQAIMRVSLAQVLILQGEYSESITHLAKAQWIGKRMGSKYIRFGGLLAQSWGAHAVSKNDLSSLYLGKALKLAAKEQYVSIPGWPHNIMSYLLEKALHEGIESEYVKFLISEYKITPTGSFSNHPDWPWKIKMTCESGFEVIIQGEAQIPKGKSQKKPLELIHLLSFYSKGLPKAKIADLLYEEDDADKAMQSLDTTIFRARKLLKDKKAIVILKGRYCLNPKLCHSHMSGLNDELAKKVSDISAIEAFGSFEEIKSLCASSGTINDEPELLWLVAEQQAMRDKIIRYLDRCVLKVDSANKIEVLKFILELDETREASYQDLIATYQSLGQNIEAYKVWLECKEVFERLYGLLPSQKTRNQIAS